MELSDLFLVTMFSFASYKGHTTSVCINGLFLKCLFILEALCINSDHVHILYLRNHILTSN